MKDFQVKAPRKGFSTRAIHSGYVPEQAGGALTPPVHLTSTFAFDTVEDAAAAFAGEREAHVYSRISNPTLDLLERRVADLEGAEAGIAFASGMGAITSVLWSLLRPGDEILADRTLYGCTYAFLTEGLRRFGVTVRMVDFCDRKAFIDALSHRPRVVYFETPANPTMKLIDIEAISKAAHRSGATVVVDNTFATPVLTRPIELGADLVVHSATKYLGGHGDLVAGLAVGSADLIATIRLYGLKDMTGAALAPFNAMLVLRGLKTLCLRMERHSASASVIAEALTCHHRVKQVLYPGLKSFPQIDLAKRQMALPGGMIGLELAGDFGSAKRFANALRLIRRAVSLGDAETLIQHPASMTHSTYTPEALAAHELSPTMLRLSIGLEDPEDLLYDLQTALSLDHALSAPSARGCT